MIQENIVKLVPFRHNQGDIIDDKKLSYRKSLINMIDINAPVVEHRYTDDLIYHESEFVDHNDRIIGTVCGFEVDDNNKLLCKLSVCNSLLFCRISTPAIYIIGKCTETEDEIIVDKIERLEIGNNRG